jgi:Luciferase-like monooxygenase
MKITLGTFGAWLNPKYDDAARIDFAAEAEALGYGTVWLGLGQRDLGEFELVERVLDNTGQIVVATAIVNMWTNDPGMVAESYGRIQARHPDRFLLGLGVGHPESVAGYRSPYQMMVSYLDTLDTAGVPADRRILAALGPRTLRLAADRATGSHPYLTVPAHTRAARRELGPEPLLAPEHAATSSAIRTCAGPITSTTSGDTDTAQTTWPMGGATGSSTTSSRTVLPRPSPRALVSTWKPALITSRSRSSTNQPRARCRATARCLSPSRPGIAHPPVTGPGAGKRGNWGSLNRYARSCHDRPSARWQTRFPAKRKRPEDTLTSAPHP